MWLITQGKRRYQKTWAYPYYSKQLFNFDITNENLYILKNRTVLITIIEKKLDIK